LIPALLALASNLALYAWVLIVLDRLPATIALHYNVLGVVDQVGSPTDLFKMPGMGSLLLAVNTGIAWRAARRDLAIALILVWVAVLAQAMLAVAIWTFLVRAAA
jgi:hypothetical protein